MLRMLGRLHLGSFPLPLGKGDALLEPADEGTGRGDAERDEEAEEWPR